MKIIVGYDGSDSAKAALEDLPRAGLPASAEAIVVSIAGEPLLAPPPPSAYEFLRSNEDAGGPLTGHGDRAVLVGRALEVAALAREQVRSTFPSWKVRAEAAPGRASAHLIQKAKEWKAHLLILGSRRRRLLERLLVRSVSEKLLSEATCSVRVGRKPHDSSDDAPIKLVVGIDASANSQATVREVARRKWPAGTRARVVAAMHPVAIAAAARASATAAPWSERATVDESVLAESNAEAAAEELRASGLDVALVVQQGDPKLVLLDEAQKSSADCIFVGATRFGWIKRLLVGSVSLWVALHAPCSVEVVRAPVR